MSGHIAWQYCARRRGTCDICGTCVHKAFRKVHNSASLTRAARLILGFVTFVLVVALCVVGMVAPFGPLSSAYAVKTHFAPTENAQNVTPIAQTTQYSQPITIDSTTFIVSSTSGYTAHITISNTSDHDYAEGVVRITANPAYTFRTSTDMQKWADGDIRISTPVTLAEVSVPALRAGEHTTVTASLPADSPILANFTTWGARPLLFTYATTSTHDNSEVSHRMQSFVTRTNADLPSKDLPQLSMTMSLPVSMANIEACDIDHMRTQIRTSISQIVTAQSLYDTQLQQLVSCTHNTVRRITTLLRDNPSISVMPDSYMAHALLSSQSASASTADTDYTVIANATHRMQSTGVDISTLGSLGYASTQSTSAQSPTSKQSDQLSASEFFHTAIQDADSGSIAWQGNVGWTLDALRAARNLGYSAVVASTDYVPEFDSAVHTSHIQVPVDGGDVTVLPTQHLLSTLARNLPTSQNAYAENSEAGRINRFIAQSAFYETQAPYEQRHILVGLADLSTHLDEHHLNYLHTLAQNLTQASWLTHKDLTALLQTEPAYNDDTALSLARDVPAASKKVATHAHEILTQNAKNRSLLSTFGTHIVVESSHHTEAKNANPQSLARGEADKDGYPQDISSTSWVNALYNVSDDLSLYSLNPRAISQFTPASQSDKNEKSGHDSDSSLTAIPSRYIMDDVLSHISISAPQSVTVVSQSATFPVTISNSLPFDIQLGVQAQPLQNVTSEVSVSPLSPQTVQAQTEQQRVMDVRALAGWKTNFAISLTSPAGVTIGQSSTTEITSSIGIFDGAGYIIVALAFILAVLGARRQMTRHTVTEPKTEPKDDES